MNRREEYQDERWKARAAEIRNLDDHRCCRCGRKDVELHVHHLAYPPTPFHVWDAADNELVTLCKNCHEEVHRCTKRPIFTDSRSLFVEASAIDNSALDCGNCKYNLQEFLLDEIEKMCFDCDGYCVHRGGEGCCFKEAVRCKKCTFLSACSANDNSFACPDYRRRRCQYCYHYQDGQGTEDDICKWTGERICWHDDCESCKGEGFVSRVDNIDELDEYLKQFD